VTRVAADYPARPSIFNGQATEKYGRIIITMVCIKPGIVMIAPGRRVGRKWVVERIITAAGTTAKAELGKESC
jgi:hypothetical protein